MKDIVNNTICAFLLVFVGASCTNNNNNNYDPECVQEMPDFGNVEIMGSFANDLGCIYTSIYIDGYYYDYYEGVEILAKEIFRSNDKEKMVQLIDKIYLQHSTIVKESNDDFAIENIQYTPIKISKDKKNCTVTCWVVKHASMIPVQEYQLLEFRINSNGNIEQKRLNSFSHSM